MTWFSASVIVAVRALDHPEVAIVAYENVLLIEASTFETASLEAERLARLSVSDDQTVTLDGGPARMEFIRVRKVTKVSNPYPHSLDSEPPVSGTELTYSMFRLEGEDELNRLGRGECVTVQYLE